MCLLVGRCVQVAGEQGWGSGGEWAGMVMVCMDGAGVHDGAMGSGGWMAGLVCIVSGDGGVMCAGVQMSGVGTMGRTVALGQRRGCLPLTLSRTRVGPDSPAVP